MLVSRNSRLGFRVLKLDLFESIRLPDLNKEDRRASTCRVSVGKQHQFQSVNQFIESHCVGLRLPSVSELGAHV